MESYPTELLLIAAAAGIVVNLAIQDTEDNLLKDKLDAIGYSFLIPVFFIVAGMRFYISTLCSEPMAPVQVLLLPGLLLLIRGIPLILYRNDIKPDDQIPFALYPATGLPLIIIISEIGVDSGYMATNRASVLIRVNPSVGQSFNGITA